MFALTISDVSNRIYLGFDGLDADILASLLPYSDFILVIPIVSPTHELRIYAFFVRWTAFLLSVTTNHICVY